MNAATAYLQELTGRTGVTPMPNHEPSFWLRARIVDLHARWSSGQTLACRHVLDAKAVCMAALWMPEIMVCATCAPAILWLPDGPDNACDRCGTTDPSTRAVAVVDAGVIITFGLCTPCGRREFPS